ncbi:restriction endonuclease subunit S [Clostridium omnivorum]|uniref:Type I restriction modification DNA specificity domain-containing protein n=1 Tax=Clostridium omnivorum TaxID=1604902 RepID=A0ABQ5N7F3_9CLOT|nr:restriction endonuclease subunit S [Clostridium sp. E14]GLC31163.1 hypothetical protein bsdE14_25730 [Clostridium sp. E14]
MAVSERCNYDIFVGAEEWTVDTLITKLNITNEKRIPVTELVKINSVTLKELNLEGNISLPYVEVKNVDADNKILDIQNLVEMQIKDLPARARYVGYPGDILLSSIRPERGAIAILPHDYEYYAVSSNFFVLSPIDIPSELLYFVLSDESVLNEFGSLASGSTIPTMTVKQFKSYRFKEFDKSSNNINAAINIYNKLINRVQNFVNINDAADIVFKDKLLVTNNANKNLPKFKAIDYSLLSDRFDAEFLLSINSPSIEWKVKSNKIKDIALVENPPSEAKRNEYVNDELPIIQTKNLQENSIYIDSKDVEFVKIDDESSKGVRFLRPTDIIVAKIGANLSKSAIIPSDLKGAISNPNSYIIRNEHGDVLTEYLLLFLRTSMAQEQIEAQIKSGSAMKMLKLSMLKEIEVPLPGLDMQGSIVDEINKRANINDESTLENDIKLFKQNLFIS